MISDNLRKFDLYFPGSWIEGTDRDWAFQTMLILRQIEILFIESVAAYSLFIPINIAKYREMMNKDCSPYKRCLNSLYAKAFVFGLDGISKLLSRLRQNLQPPPEIVQLCEEYDKKFGHLRHIRDSAIHIEDRGRGVTRSQKPINTNFLVLGGFIESRFSFTGEDGNNYEVEISEAILNEAKAIIQEVINVYSWSPI